MAKISGSLLFDRSRTATVSGTMIGIANVPIVLQSTSTGAMLAVLTDNSGNYNFTNVPNGNYQAVEAYGTPASLVGTGDFSLAVIAPMMSGGVVPPYSYVSNPLVGASNLDCTIRNTRLLTVSGADLTAVNFLNGPVLYTPVSYSLDVGVVVSAQNLVTELDAGTFGNFAPGTNANTGASPNPYPDIGSNFIFVQPNPNTLTPADGQYTIQNLMNNAAAIGSGSWWVVADRTQGNETGRMMVVNGYDPGAVILTKNVAVIPGQNYIFSSWILNLMKKTVGYVNPSFGVNVYDQQGDILYNQRLGGDIPTNPVYPEWHEIGSVILNPPGNSALKIEFISQGPAASGNDYVIDSLGLYEISYPIYNPVKTASAAEVNLGNTVTYTITLEYPGNDALTDVFFMDVLPSGMVFTSGSVRVNGVNMPDANPGDGFTVPDINGGESLTVSFDAIAAQIPDVNPTVNNAQVKYSYTPVLGGIISRYDTVSNDVEVEILAADLGVEKSADSTTVFPGDFIEFTLTVTNYGPSVAINPVLVDNIPAQMRDVVYSTDGGTSWSIWNGSLFLPNLQALETIDVLLKGQVQFFATGSLVNTASIFSDTTDQNSDNNTSDVTIFVTQSADISVVKLASPSTVAAGGVLTYTIVVSNAGPSIATNVELDDTVPDSVLAPVYSLDGGVSWTPWVSPLILGNLARSSAITVQIMGTVSSTAIDDIVNTAIVQSSTPDPNPDNNTSIVTTPIDVPIPAQADMAVVKTTYPTIIPGHGIDYTIIIDNHGPDDAQDVILVDATTAEVMNPEYSIGGALPWSPWVGSLSLGTVAYQETITVVIRGTVGPATTEIITNTATILSSTPDPNLLNNSSEVTTQPVPSADMQVTKISMQSPIVAGNMLTYRISVRNNGPSYAHDIVVEDTISDCILNPEYSTDGLEWFPWQDSYTIGSLANNASFNIRIRGTVDPNKLGNITNEATVDSITPDPDYSNNTSTANAEIVALADVSIVKSADQASAVAGEALTFTLTVANAGPSTAEDVVVSDAITTRITDVQYSVDGGANWLDWLGSVDIGALMPGVVFDVLIRGTLIPNAQGHITNIAIVSSETPDPDTSNNTFVVNLPIIPRFADLSVTKTASAASVQAGDVLTYTIIVQNLGPNDATNLIISDIMPLTLTGAEFSMDGGFSWVPWSGNLELGSIMANSKLTMLIRATVADASFPISNTVRVSSDTPDPDLSDNSATAVTHTTRTCDLTMVKSADVSPVTPGEPVTFVLIITNNGPAVAENVIVSDAVSARITGVKYSLDSGQTWGDWSGSVSLDTLEAGGVVELLLRGDLVSTAVESIVNTAIATSTTHDSNFANNWAAINVLVDPLQTKSADLSLVKTTENSTIRPGDTVTYKITITNNGPDSSSDVALIDKLPPALMAGEFSIDNGATWEPWGDRYTLGTMQPKDAKTILLRGILAPLTSHVINAAMVTSATPDPDLSNNFDVALSKAPCPTPISKEGALNQIVASIAMEELALSHIINAEGEKIQYVIGTLHDIPTGATVEDVLKVNAAVEKVLDVILRIEIILKEKLEKALNAYP